MNKYNTGKIYTIRCLSDNKLIYVGSTIQPLYKRWSAHKTQMNNEKNKLYNILLYIKMREIGVQQFYIELYENFSCENREQLNRREGEVIREISTLNKLIAGRTKQEYYADNKEKFSNYDKKYYEENKEKIAETKRKYRELNKEKFKTYKTKYDEENKEKQKEYYIKNRDKILARQKIYSTKPLNI